MAEYDLAVYTSESLRTYAERTYGEPHRPQTLTAAFVRGAFEPTGHSVHVETPSTPVPAPLEQHRRPFVAPSPGRNGPNHSYPTLLVWFDEWLDATDRHRGRDGTLLLTDTGYPNGGLAGKAVAVARTGRGVCGLPCDYEPFGYTVAHDALHTVLHEVGHLLMGPIDETDDDGLGHHDVGTVYDRPTGKTASPMGVEGSENECGEQVDDSDAVGVELTWSDCCLSHWKPPRESPERRRVRGEGATT